MMKPLGIWPMLIVLCMMMGCSPIYNVSYDYNQSISVASLSGYDWLPVPEETDVNSLDMERIKNAVDAELNAKGLTRNPEDPDFLIAADLIKKDREIISPLGYSYYPYWVYRGFWSYDYYQYQEGTFILDFLEPSSGRLIWHGAAKAELDFADTPGKRDKLIKEAIRGILQNFPPRP